MARRWNAPAENAVRPLLCIDALAVSLGDKQVIKNLSLSLHEGERLGLVGASGSGKTLTALSILKLLPSPARISGTIKFRGDSLTGMTDAQLRRIRGHDIGMVFQEPMTALNPLMRVGAQIAETVRLHRPVSRTAANALAREALDLVGLSGKQGALDRYPHELSGGQRQRVAIAIAVVLRPALLIADEPTTALDVQAQEQVLELLCTLCRAQRMGLILVSHDLAVVARVTDRIAVMHHGAVVEEMAASATLRDLRHPYSIALRSAADLPAKRHTPHVEPTPLLEVRDIVREYKLERRSLWGRRPVFRAIDGVSLIVNPGSGKSSLLRVILALDRPQSGDVRVRGEPFSSAGGAALSRLRRSIQAVFQDPYGSFDPEWCVERLVAEPFFLSGSVVGKAEQRRRVAVVLEQVGLSAADARCFPHEFSGGQRQRIAIARALITEPALIVFDEAVSALDVLVRAQVLKLLAELSDRLRLAYLFISHDLNVVKSIADRIYVMQRGRIVEEGLTRDIFGSPQHTYTRALIAATPQLRAANFYRE
jgi:peptide/nickel transport system ATP-binding protein